MGAVAGGVVAAGVERFHKILFMVFFRVPKKGDVPNYNIGQHGYFLVCSYFRKLYIGI